MNEKTLLKAFNEARLAYDANPNHHSAFIVLKFAQALNEISDDYAELLDEADDIMSEP